MEPEALNRIRTNWEHQHGQISHLPWLKRLEGRQMLEYFRCWPWFGRR